MDSSAPECRATPRVSQARRLASDHAAESPITCPTVRPVSVQTALKAVLQTIFSHPTFARLASNDTSKPADCQTAAVRARRSDRPAPVLADPQPVPAEVLDLARRHDAGGEAADHAVQQAVWTDDAHGRAVP